MSGTYKRSPEELKRHASLYWPRELTKGSAGEVISLLLQTQDKFLAILSVADREPTSWKQVLEASSMWPNLFLKHLVVLADVGGELIKKITPIREQTMRFNWHEKEHTYRFRQASAEKLDNKHLHIDSESVVQESALNEAMEDMIMVLLFGGFSTNLDLPEDVAQKCIIGTLLGDKEAIEQFIRPRYILVSRIIRGATANALGQAAQTYILKRLQTELGGCGWQFQRNGTIPGISQTSDQRLISFDIVAISPRGKYFAVEVSFQVTTNSTIERKSGQAKDRYQKLHEKGFQIAYVVDGAGNFERESALRTICEFSDCTVAFTESEIDVLIDFLRSSGGDRSGSLE